MTTPSPERLLEELQEWAFEKSSIHNRLAHENKNLRTEHIASSTAYRELALEITERAAALRSLAEEGEGESNAE